MKEPVGVIGYNSEEYISTLFKIWDKGQVPALLDYRIPSKRAIEIMESVGIKRAYIDKRIAGPFLKQNVLDVQMLAANDEREIVLRDSCKAEYEKVRKFGDGIILFSSGTTGDNKGILLSHESMLGNARAIMERMKITFRDTIYIVKSLNHSSTFIGELLVGFESKANVVISSYFYSAQYFIDALCRYKVTITCLNVEILSLVLNAYQKMSNRKDLSLREIYISGEMCPETLILEARNTFLGCRIYNMYGLTEAGPRVTMQREDASYQNSCGLPIKGVEIRICDEYKNTKKSFARGLIYVKTPYKMEGYVRNGKLELLEEEWINTKDIGFLDDNGELYIVGRSDNMINISAHNVFPEEIEKIAASHPWVNACAILKERNIFSRGKLICYIELKENYKENDKKDICRQLRAIFQKELASYEIPSKYFFIEKIPRTLSGKIARNKLYELI